MTAVYTVADVARLLGVSEDSVRRGAQDGWIPAVQVTASRWVYPRAAIDSWLAMPGFQLATLLRQIDGGPTPAQASTARQLLQRMHRLISDVEAQLEPEAGELLELVK
jgi:excisionase family DNA binding protein